MTDCNLLSLEASDFHYLMAQNPELRRRVEGMLKRGARVDYGQAGETPWIEPEKAIGP